MKGPSQILVFTIDTDTSLDIIFFHVDDVILCGHPESIRHVIKNNKNKFKILDLGFPTEILGIQIRKDKQAIYLSTDKSELKVISEYEMDNSKGSSTPLPPGLKLPPLLEVLNPVVILKYRNLLGKLLYISRCVRFDICYAVNLLCRYSSNHNTTMWKLLKGILKFLGDNQMKLEY